MLGWNVFVWFVWSLWSACHLFLSFFFLFIAKASKLNLKYMRWLAGHLYFILRPFGVFFLPKLLLLLLRLYYSEEAGLTCSMRVHIVPKKFKTWWPNRAIFFFYLSVAVAVFDGLFAMHVECWMCWCVLLNLSKWNGQKRLEFFFNTVSSLRIAHK